MLAIGQDVTLAGNRTVEKVVGRSRLKLPSVGWKMVDTWSVQVVLLVVLLELEIGAVVDDAIVAAVGPAVLLVELPREKEGGVTRVGEAAKVFIAPAAVALVGNEVAVLVGKEVEDCVNTAKLVVVFAVSFGDIEDIAIVTVGAELFTEDGRADIVESDMTTDGTAGGVEDAEMPVSFWVLTGRAAAELELVKIGEQHEDEKGVAPLGVTVTIMLVETVMTVGVAVLPVPSRDELNVHAKLRDADRAEPSPTALAALALADVVSVRKFDGPGVRATDEEVLRGKGKLPGGRAEIEDMEKPATVDEFVAVALLFEIVSRSEVVAV